jgi:hypothetical protein
MTIVASGVANPTSTRNVGGMLYNRKITTFPASTTVLAAAKQCTPGVNEIDIVVYRRPNGVGTWVEDKTVRFDPYRDTFESAGVTFPEGSEPSVVFGVIAMAKGA